MHDSPWSARRRLSDLFPLPSRWIMTRTSARALTLTVALTLLVIALQLARPGIARAERGPACSPSLLAWLDRCVTTAPSHALTVMSASCPGPVAVFELAAGSERPLKVELTCAPGSGFRQAGGCGFSPIGDFPRWADEPADIRAALDQLVACAGQDSPASALREPAPADPDRERARVPVGPTDEGDEPAFFETVDAERSRASGLARAPFDVRPAWYWLFALALVWIVRARRVRGPATDDDDDPTYPKIHVLLALFLIACAARLALGVWGPLHVNGQGPAWVQLLTGGAGINLARYGPGYPEVYLPLVTWLVKGLGAAPDLTLFTVNALLSATAALLLVAVAVEAGLGRGPALLAGGIMALDPLQVRFATTENYFTPIIVLTLAAGLLVMRASVCVERRAHLDAGLLAVAAGLLASQAARIHPIAWLPVALCPLPVLFVSTGARTMARRLLYTAAALAVVGGIVVLTSRGELEAVRGQLLDDHGMGQFVRLQDLPRASVYTGLAVTAAAFVWATRGGSRVIFFVFPVALIHLCVAVVTRTSYGQFELWRSSYDRLYAPIIILALASLWPRRDGPRWTALTAGAALASALVITAVHAPAIVQPTTEQLEYRLVRGRLASIEGPCALLYINEIGRGRMVVQPEYALRDRRGWPARPVTMPDGQLPTIIPTPNRCVVYIHSSLCTSPEGRPRCDEVERRLGLARVEAIESARLPARPSHVSMTYDRELVDVAIYRLTPGS